MHALRDTRSPAVESYAVGVNWLGNLEWQDHEGEKRGV